MRNERTRLNGKIALWIVRAGYFDNRHEYSMKTSFEYNIRRKNRFTESSQRWRNAYLFDEGLRDLLNNGVPMWFINRYRKFIAKHFIWEKQSSSGWDYGSRLFVDFENISNDFALDRDAIVMYMDIDIMKNYKQNGFIRSVEVECTDRMGIVSIDIIRFWRIMRDRFIAINGRYCKMCNTVKHDKGIVCNDLDKYRIHICNDCLKKFCKLDDMAKSILIRKRIKR